jgi:hypothetical protein
MPFGFSKQIRAAASWLRYWAILSFKLKYHSTHLLRSLLIFEDAPPVAFEIVLGWPERLFSWAEDRAVGKRQHVAGHVLAHPDPPWDQDLVTCPYAHEPFVKGPVAEAAEGQAVRGPVIPALAPWDDVGRLNNGVAL